MNDTSSDTKGSRGSKIAHSCLTVGELRKQLYAFDKATLVFLPGGEGGFQALQHLQLLDVVMNVNKDPHFGPHDVPTRRQRPHGQAVVLLAQPPPRPQAGAPQARPGRDGSL